MPKPANNPKPASNTKPADAGYDSPQTVEQTWPQALNEWLPALAIVAIVFVVYVFTAPRTVTLEDDGLFIMASIDAGVAHPPGYPLYTMLGHLFAHLPVEPSAYRIHLLSGLLGAMTCGILFFVARLAGLSRWFALAVALAYGVSEHFWSQAIIAEVYTLNALLCFSIFLCCLKALTRGDEHNAPLRKRLQTPAKNSESNDPVRELVIAAFLFGLGLANHWPLLTLAFPAYVMLLWPKRRFVWRRIPALLAIALATAGVFYLWMVWRSWQPGLVSFYGPISSVQDFLYYISRQGYGSVDASPSANIIDQFRFLLHFLGEVLFLFTPVGALLALLGVYRLHRAKSRQLLFASAWIFAAHSLALIFTLRFDYEYLNIAVFRPYPLVAYGVLAFWMGCGLSLVWEMVQARLPAWSERMVFQVSPALALLIPLFVFQQNIGINDRSEDRFAEEYGRLLLNGLAEDAVLFVIGDTTTGPLGYLHHTEGVRPDIELINKQGLVYPNRLFVPPTTSSKRAAALENFLRDNERPVYLVTEDSEIPNPGSITYFGFYQQIGTEGRVSSIKLRFDPQATAFFESLVTEPKPQDRWNRHLHGILLQQYGGFLGYTILSNDPVLNRTAADMMTAIQSEYYGLIDMAEILIEHGSTAEHLGIARQLLEQAQPLMDDTLSKEMKGRHHYRKGFLAYREGNHRQAHEEFNSSIAAYDHPDNPSVEAVKIYQQDGADSDPD
ncbi:MAG: glycosyltransferase family 117 protein [Pseudohongiellaceae bacterium]